jgi:hypothetical protein
MKISFIEGYEDLYFVDDFGNVVAVPTLKSGGRKFDNKYLVLKQKINKYGYCEVTLYKEGKQKTFLVHRLLAKAFLPNPLNLPVVNHKNGIKSDNRLENLEWATYRENTNHALETISGFKENITKSINKVNQKTKYSKIVIVDKDGSESVFYNTQDAADFVGKGRNEVTRAIRKNQRVNGYRAYGEKTNS